MPFQLTFQHGKVGPVRGFSRKYKGDIAIFETFFQVVCEFVESLAMFQFLFVLFGKVLKIDLPLVIGFSNLRARRDRLGPLVKRRLFFADASRPQLIDKNPVAVRGLCRVLATFPF